MSPKPFPARPIFTFMKSFKTEELVIPAMWPRSTPLSVRSSQDRLNIACKLYTNEQTVSDTPTAQFAKQPSVFFVNGNGFPKECYEPMLQSFSEIMESQHGMPVSYILAIDVVNQGQSAILNETKLGNDFIWEDAWRDIAMVHYYLQLNNHPILQTPIIGAGHSLGGNVIFGSSTINTKMFKALISIDGVISHPFNVGLNAFKLPVASYLRQDVWPSREEAAKRLRKNEFYKNWTDQVFQQYVRYGLRDLPTRKYPQDSNIDKTNVPVTLTCPAHNEVTTFVNLPKPDSEFGPGSLTSSAPLVLNSPYSCLVAIQHTSTPTHMILTDIGRSSFSLYKKVYKSEPNVNENITFSCLDESKTHSVPFEDPHLVAQIMADFAAPTLQKAVEQQYRYDNEVERYYGFHPIQHQRLGPLAKRFKDEKKKLKEKL